MNGRMILVAVLALTVCFGGCSEPQKSSKEVGATCADLMLQIEAMESNLFKEGEEVQVDVSARSELSRYYADFANACHDDERTPEMLFRRADLLRSAGKFQEAMTQLRDIHDYYKHFKKRATCAFLIGFIAEVELLDREQARKLYQQVVLLHPGSKEAVWAMQSIELLDLERHQVEPN